VLPHSILTNILRKFRELHQLTLNAIMQINKFIWVVSSCGGRPTTDVFVQHYELHYQHKKIHLEGCQTALAAQFGYIIFHPSRYGGRAKLTPAMRNKWTSGWARNWFYCNVPSEQKANVRGKGTYPLRLVMTLLEYLTDAPYECGPVDVNVVAFIEVAAIIRVVMLLKNFSPAVSGRSTKAGSLKWRRGSHLFQWLSCPCRR
jgi:hypothetical protein